MTGRNQLVPGISWLILGFILLRMVCSWLLGDQVALFAQPEVAAYLLKEQTPEQTTPPVTTTVPTVSPTEPITTTAPATEPVTEPPTMPEVPDQGYRFLKTDASIVEVNYSAKRSPDLEALLTQPLAWDLTAEEPAVLIFHTHGTEAFVPTDGYTYEEEGGEYRTTDADCNILSLGEELVRLLNEAGIPAIQDRTYYDYPDYTESYDNARTGLQKQLEKYPSVKLVIDLHRDSAEQSNGGQWATEAVINGERSAQVMLVVGTNAYYTHPNWEQNLSLALKLHTIMEKTHSGSTRPLDLRKQRFNQDLSTGAIIAEIGAAGNTHREAMNAVSVLAEAIILLAKGAN
jgi:stage II sporulation protein P